MTLRLLPRGIRLAVASCTVALIAASPAARAASNPNIIYILCDDLGYGDVKCLNADGKIATPNMDRLGKEGMRFTDAHSSSAVCSPTRYGVLTGRYNWRSRLQSGVLGGLSPRLIEPGRMTVASLLKDHGYATGCIGKWHLGMDWVKLPGKDVSELNIESVEQVHNVDFAQPIKNGPNSVGFDFYYGISASLDMVPYTFIQNDHVTVLPTTDKSFPLTEGRKSNPSRLGPAAPEFEARDVLPTLTRKAVEFVGQHAAEAKSGKPFFLYLPLNAPHTPIVPSAEWQGKSGISPYADYVMETDWAIGEVLRALDQQGLAENTLVMFTSDNGCSPQANFAELAEKGHNPSYVFRGTKADIFDGGHHIPFIARWPGKIKAGTTSDQITCLTDFMATCAEIIGAKLPDDAGEDSVSMLPALLGKADKPLREAIVHHSINGSFAIRQGNWKLELCSSSGGWSAPRPNTVAAKGLPAVQLYDMTADIGEKTNTQADHTELVDRLTHLLEKYVADGRSTPGAPQKNDVPIELWKDRTFKAKSGSAD
ncbi:MAG: arylsulfatase [Chthoniobacter sp.]|uniref:sulfatase family protein n=1 Tax=Chthoniobacter sp. TaxID=2510640 RepID=UPI0032A79A4D